MLSDAILNQIKPILKKTFEDKTYEFEIMFNNYRSNNKLSFVKFIDLLYFIKYRVDNNSKYKLIEETTLDISYNYIDNKNNNFLCFLVILLTILILTKTPIILITLPIIEQK